MIFSISCLFQFSHAPDFSNSSLFFFFRIFAETRTLSARTHGQILTVGSKLVKTFSRHVIDWNEFVGGANWPRNTL